jgi:hypothetical protein
MALLPTYEDRLGDIAIFTPDDEFYQPAWTDFEKTVLKKTSAYDFGETDKQLIQDFGVGAVDIPMTVFFEGQNYDKTAQKFDDSLSVKGRSELFHPIYGRFNVVITQWTRRDALVSGRGQAIFVLTISETIIPERPATGLETKGAITSDMDDMAAANAGVFEENFDAGIVGDAIAAKNRVTKFIADTKSTFQQALSTVAAIQSEFDAIEKSILSNIDFLLTAPLQLATALIRLVRSPSRLANKVKDRVELYRGLYESQLVALLGNGQDVKNQNAEKQLLTTSILSAMAESNLFPENEPDADKDTGETLGFLTQGDAINAAADLATDYAAIQEFLDDQQLSNESIGLENRFVVSDEITSFMKQISASTAQNLIRLSFSLNQEKIIGVQNDTNIITMCYALYGTTENDKLDFFIQTNNLTGEDLLTIKKGTLIKSYA